MSETIQTPVSDAAKTILYICGEPCTDGTVPIETARSLERRAIVAEQRLAIAEEALRLAIENSSDEVESDNMRDALAAIAQIKEGK